MCADGLGNDFSEPRSEDRQSLRINLRIWNSQYDEHDADRNTLEASSKDGVNNDRECFVDYHVRREKSYEEKVAIF